METALENTNGAAPAADHNGVEITHDLGNSISGLCLIGTLVRHDVRGRSAEFEGFTSGIVSTGYGEYKVEIARATEGITGYVDLAAYPKLAGPDAIGKRWCIVVGVTKTVAANGKTYTNYTAVDAFPL